MQKKKSSSSEELYGEYGHAFNFTQGDLEANRAGFITKRQRKMAYNRFFRQNLLLFLCLTFVAALAFLWGRQLLENWTSSIIYLILCAGTVIFFQVALFASMFLQVSRGMYADLQQGRVKTYSSYEAYSQHIITKGNGNPNDYPDFIVLALRPNIRIYTLPRTARVVSVEIINAADDMLDAKIDEPS